jgi:hypothetical protein
MNNLLLQEVVMKPTATTSRNATYRKQTITTELNTQSMFSLAVGETQTAKKVGKHGVPNDRFDTEFMTKKTDRRRLDMAKFVSNGDLQPFSKTLKPAFAYPLIGSEEPQKQPRKDNRQQQHNQIGNDNPFFFREPLSPPDTVTCGISDDVSHLSFVEDVVFEGASPMASLGQTNWVSEEDRDCSSSGPLELSFPSTKVVIPKEFTVCYVIPTRHVKDIMKNPPPFLEGLICHDERVSNKLPASQISLSTHSTMSYIQETDSGTMGSSNLLQGNQEPMRYHHRPKQPPKAERETHVATLRPNDLRIEGMTEEQMLQMALKASLQDQEGNKKKTEQPHAEESSVYTLERLFAQLPHRKRPNKEKKKWTFEI